MGRMEKLLGWAAAFGLATGGFAWSPAPLAAAFQVPGQPIDDNRALQFERQILLKRQNLQDARMRPLVVRPIRLENQLEKVEPEEAENRLTQLVFQQDRTLEAAHQRLNLLLEFEVGDIDRACDLTAPQKKKLELMGRGDIKRFFDRFEIVKVKFLALELNPRDLQRGNFGELTQDINSLQVILRVGPFHNNSLLYKSLSNTLSEEQIERFRAKVRERLQSSHLVAIRQLIKAIERPSPMSDAQRQKITDLLARDIEPCQNPGPYNLYYLLFQLERLPEENLKSLLNDAQWQALNQFRNQRRQFETVLQKAGYLPTKDDEDEKPEPPMARQKK